MSELEPSGMFEELMLRGGKLRALRLLALADEEERKEMKENEDNKEEEYYLHNEHNNQHEIEFYSPSSILNIAFVQDVHEKAYACAFEEKKNLPAGVEVLSQDATTFTSSKTVLAPAADRVDVLPDSKLKVLRYGSYLAHQRYYDDYKHCNCTFVDFPIASDDSDGSVSSEKRIVLEQQQSLGKGGILWDAAVVLADHILALPEEWKKWSLPTINDDENAGNGVIKVLELGAGVGLAGIAVAKSVPKTIVYITDLPELIPLMKRNLGRNFDSGLIVEEDHSDKTSDNQSMTRNFTERGKGAKDIPIPRHFDRGFERLTDADEEILYNGHHSKNETDDVLKSSLSSAAGNNIMASILRWGVPEDYGNGPYDVILGADVVASLYCPTALAQTIYDLSHERTRVYVSVKRRLDEQFYNFKSAMENLFYTVEIKKPLSRLKNNEIVIFHANRKR